MIHELKTWPAYFEAVIEGRKPFESRIADRTFNVGDTLRLREWDPDAKSYTGRSADRIVTCRLFGPGLGVEAGWVVMGLAVP